MTKEKRTFSETLELPQGASATQNGVDLTIKGKFGEVTKPFLDSLIEVKAEGNKVSVRAIKSTKLGKKKFGAARSHLKNMIKGADEGHKYVLKICSSHFPMTVTAKGEKVEVKNFFGERHTRTIKLIPNVKIKVNGQDIEIESADKEAAGQAAATIEKRTKRADFDKRIFQDGVHMTNKAGKEIGQ